MRSTRELVWVRVTQSDAIVCLSTILIVASASAQQCDQDWSSVGGGTSGGITFPAVLSMRVFDDGLGAGPALYVGGNFTHVGSTLVNHVARWNGSSWSALQQGLGGQINGSVYDMIVWDDDGMGPRPPALFVAGNFATTGAATARDVVRWDGIGWTALGQGVSWGIFDSEARSFAVFDDDGTGPIPPALYVAGGFTHAGAMLVNHIARWNGSNWTSVGGGMNERIYDLAVFDDGNGPALYAAGIFTTAGTAPAQYIARWNGHQWTGVGTGGGFNTSLLDLYVFDDGGGEDLYAGGAFTIAGGVPANRIARWDGVAWSALGSGLSSDLPFPTVEIMLALDDHSGHGHSLYVGGQFHFAGGLQANNIARWDGAAWSTLGIGAGGDNSIASVYSLGAFDAGAGENLFAGGYFNFAGSALVFNIASWNSCPLGPADLNGDGVINTLDLGILLSSWSIPPTAPACGGSLPCPADINGDGFVNTLDLGILLSSWTL